MSDQNDDFELSREIERSWLIRGEYDKVFEGRTLPFCSLSARSSCPSCWASRSTAWESSGKHVAILSLREGIHEFLA